MAGPMTVANERGRITSLSALIQTEPGRAEDWLRLAKDDLGRWPSMAGGVEDVVELWSTVLTHAPRCAEQLIAAIVRSEDHWAMLYWLLEAPESRKPATLDLLIGVERHMFADSPQKACLYGVAMEVSIADALLSGKLDGWNHLVSQKGTQTRFSSLRGEGDLAFLVIDCVMAHGDPLLDGLDALLLRQALSFGGDVNSECSYDYERGSPRPFKNLLSAACSVADQNYPHAHRAISLLLDFGADWTGLDRGTQPGAATIRAHKRWVASERRDALVRVAADKQVSEEVRRL